MIADAVRRWKHARRIAAARRELAARTGEGCPHGLPGELIISLTSYPPRFGSLHLVLRSLLNQTVRADRVVLWVTKDDHRLLPPEVTALAVDIRVCPQWRSYKKIIPTLMEWPSAHIVTADDDVHYPADWLAQLVAEAHSGVACHRAHRVVMAGNAPAAYDDWQRNIALPATGPLIFPTGVGGVLYAPGAFHPDVTDVAAFSELAPSADDVWLYWMHRRAGSQPRKIGGRYRIVEWPGTQAESLRSTNLAGDGNDRAVAAMLDRYGFPQA